MHKLDDSFVHYVRLTNNEQLHGYNDENNEPAHQTTARIGKSRIRLSLRLCIRVDVMLCMFLR